MQKKTKIILISVLAAVAVVLAGLFSAYYLIMVKPTNEITAYGKSVIYGDMHANADDPFSRYNFDGNISPVDANIHGSFSRTFVWLKGNTGYIKVKYNVTGRAENGDYALSGSDKWVLQKVNGEWQISCIEGKAK